MIFSVQEHKKGKYMDLKLISTTYEGNIRHTTEKVIPFIDDGGRENKLINLYPQVKYQKMEGFGGAITDSAAYIYSLMNPEQKKQMLNEYFGKNNMKYRFVRIPIDSCDFSLEHFEADGDENDATFEKFSFDRVEKYILPMLMDAEIAYGGKLEIMLSPWSPPAYMKTNGERNHGGKLKECYWKRWAEYICRYIEEYRNRGFNVTMLTLQNEPKAVQTWDSCIFTAEEEKVFLRDYVWPSLVAHRLNDIEIYIWDHNKERAFEWAETIIDGETDHMIAGLAFHWYSGDHFEALQMIRERFPKKKLLLSEACIEFSKYSADDNLANAQKYAHDIIGDLNSGMSTFLDWNLVLDEKGGPNHVNNFCDAPYMLDIASGTLLPRELQSYIWHFSHFIETGTIRIGVSRYSDLIEIVAFANQDRIVVILLNRAKDPVDFYLRIKDRTAEIHLNPQSISSGVIQAVYGIN